MKDDNTITILRVTRQNTLLVLDGLSLESINTIPDGFTGNIAWHIGHMVATHQGLVYRLQGAPGTLEPDFLDKYKKGSVPQAPIDAEELSFIKTQLIQQVDELVADLERHEFFGDTSPYTTSYGYEITSLEDALYFNNVHQGLHLGYIMAMKRSL